MCQPPGGINNGAAEQAMRNALDLRRQRRSLSMTTPAAGVQSGAGASRRPMGGLAGRPAAVPSVRPGMGAGRRAVSGLAARVYRLSGAAAAIPQRPSTAAPSATFFTSGRGYCFQRPPRAADARTARRIALCCVEQVAPTNFSAVPARQQHSQRSQRSGAPKRVVSDPAPDSRPHQSRVQPSSRAYAPSSASMPPTPRAPAGAGPRPRPRGVRRPSRRGREFRAWWPAVAAQQRSRRCGAGLGAEQRRATARLRPD